MYEAHQPSSLPPLLATFDPSTFHLLRERTNMLMHMPQDAVNPSQGMVVQAGHVCHAWFPTRPNMVESHVFGVVQARYSNSLPAGQTVKGQSGADTQWLRRQTTGIIRTSWVDEFRHVLFALLEEVSMIDRDPNTSPKRWKNKSSWLKRHQLAPIHMRFVSHSPAM